MALEMTTLKCPNCGEPSGLEKISLGRYHCKYCGSNCLSHGEDEASLIVVPSKEQWSKIHSCVRANGTDESLLDAYADLNKAFPVDLESEIQSIDQQSAASIKVEIQGLAGELAAFSKKGAQWNRLSTVVLRVVFCKSLFGNFDTVAQIVADVKECKAVNPHFWVKLYQTYFDAGTGKGDLSTLLSVSRIKDSLRDREGKYDEVAFYEFASFLAKSAKTEDHYEFFIAFIKDTMNDADFVSQVYPVGKLFLKPTLRKHVRTLNKAYQSFDKKLSRRSN